MAVVTGHSSCLPAGINETILTKHLAMKVEIFWQTWGDTAIDFDSKWEGNVMLNFVSNENPAILLARKMTSGLHIVSPHIFFFFLTNHVVLWSLIYPHIPCALLVCVEFQWKQLSSISLLKKPYATSVAPYIHAFCSYSAFIDHQWWSIRKEHSTPTSTLLLM